jgi:hypothetical protein
MDGSSGSGLGELFLREAPHSRYEPTTGRATARKAQTQAVSRGVSRGPADRRLGAVLVAGRSHPYFAHCRPPASLPVRPEPAPGSIQAHWVRRAPATPSWAQALHRTGRPVGYGAHSTRRDRRAPEERWSKSPPRMLGPGPESDIPGARPGAAAPRGGRCAPRPDRAGEASVSPVASECPPERALQRPWPQTIKLSRRRIRRFRSSNWR